MIQDPISKRMVYGMVFLQIVYIVTVFIAILIKAYRFSDLAIILVYMIFGSLISITLSIVHMKQLANKGIALKDSPLSFLFMQLPASILFLLNLFIVLTTEYTFN